MIVDSKDLFPKKGNLKLIIGQPIKAVLPPVSVYELVATGMSGDGDHYAKHSEFGDHDTIMPYVELLFALNNMDWNDKCEESIIAEVLGAKATELGLDVNHATDWFHDMVGNDITSDGSCYAMLNGIELFWYDATGQKFQAEIKE